MLRKYKALYKYNQNNLKSTTLFDIKREIK